MWAETVSNVLTGENAKFTLSFLGFALLFVLLLSLLLIKLGVLTINTKHVRLGKEEREREIIRRQIERAKEFIMSLEGKITNDNCNYDEYFVKYILERVYDKAIEWIMFNHITDNRIYVQDKQDTICNLVYTFPIKDKFKSPEFNERMRKWTEELVHQLIQVKQIYGVHN